MEKARKKVNPYIALNVGRLRTAKGWSMQELADRAGMKLRGVQNIEYGISGGSQSLLRIAKQLGVTAESLVSDPNQLGTWEKIFNPWTLASASEFLSFVEKAAPLKIGLALSILTDDKRYFDAVPHPTKLDRVLLELLKAK